MISILWHSLVNSQSFSIIRIPLNIYEPHPCIIFLMMFGGNAGGGGLFNNPTSGFPAQKPANTGTGGLFGNVNANPTTNLNPISLPASTDLNKTTFFGNTSSAGTGGLFSNPNSGQNPSMFGGNTGATGGIFTNQNQPPQSTNMYGNTSTGGMFGQNTGGGIFGASQNTGQGFPSFSGGTGNSAFFSGNAAKPATGTGFMNTGMAGGSNSLFPTATTNNSVFNKPATNFGLGGAATTNTGGFFQGTGTTIGGAGFATDANKAQMGAGFNTSGNTSAGGFFTSANVASMGGNTNTFNSFNTNSFTGPTGFGQNKPFAPLKPRNQTLNKQKTKIAVYCIILQDEFKHMSKEEYRCRYLLNPNSLGAASPFKSPAMGTSLNSTANPTGFLTSGANNNATNSLYNSTSSVIGGAILNNVGSGLFNTTGANSQQPAQTGGLFNTTAQTQPTNQGGLFNSTAPNNSGGLFNTGMNTSGGLFQSTAPAAGGGLFNTNQNAAQPSTGGGLFNTGGGMLGSPTPQNAMPQSGGLFNNMTPGSFLTPGQPMQPQAPAGGYYPMMDPTSVILAAYQLQQLMSQQKEEKAPTYDKYGRYSFSRAQDYNVPPGYKLVPDSYNPSRSPFDEVDYQPQYKYFKSDNDTEDLSSIRSQFKRRNLFDQMDESSPSILSSKKYSRDDKSSQYFSEDQSRPSSSYFNSRKQPSKFAHKLFQNVEEQPAAAQRKRRDDTDYDVLPEELPTCTKYIIVPNLLQLSRMSRQQLQNVENFIVKNKDAEVRFLQPVDLLGVNLDEVITLKPNCVDIAKDALKVDGKVIIKYFNFGGLKTTTDPTKREKLIKNAQNWIKKMNVELLKFNEREGELTIKT